MNRNFRSIVVLLLFILINSFVFNAYSQQAPYETDKVIYPSPTASSLGKFGNDPVSYYNGTPNISVPLYKVKTQNHSFPISMHYDPSGIKASQEASWVGLGWALKAGGIITRTVRQFDDFKPVKGYYYSDTLPPSNPDNSYKVHSEWVVDMGYFNTVYDNNIDAEPDIFSYDFNGYSGRFVLGKKQNGNKVYLDQKNNLKIEYLDVQGKWVITDGNGYKYFFNTQEWVHNYSYNGSYELANLNGIDSAFHKDLDSSPTTAWYLDSIVAPNSEAIVFTYANGKSLSIINKSERLFKLNNLILYDEDCPPGLPYIYVNEHKYGASIQEIHDIYLKKITFANGSIDFNVSSRNDIPYLNLNDTLITPSKLDNIVINDGNGQQVKKIDFLYSYFNQANTNGRLKLDAIREEGSAGVFKPPYQFSYKNSGSLPDKYTKSIDHWGFYNGRANYTLLPKTLIANSGLSFSGADREPDETEGYALNGVLSTIIYPTGGKTEFEFELNEYANLKDEQQYILVNRSAQVSSNPADPLNEKMTASFVVAADPLLPGADIPVTMSCTFTKVDNNVGSPIFTYSNMWFVKPDNSTQAVYDCTSDSDPSNNESNSSVSQFKPGNYKMQIQRVQGWSTSMTAYWQERQLINQRKGAGIRIKSISDFNAIGEKSIRRFVYNTDTGQSTGVLYRFPRYTYQYTVDGLTVGIGIAHYDMCRYKADCYYVQSNMGDEIGLSSSKVNVGYSKVTELSGENGENGKTEYYFHNVDDILDTTAFMPIISDPKNGKLDSVKVYNSLGNIVTKINSTYVIKERDKLKGLKLMKVPGPDPYSFGLKFYDNFSDWVVKDSEKETIYNGGNILVNHKNYYYDNNTHREITKEILFDSEGNELVTNYKRAGDYNLTSTASIAEMMKNDHFIAPVIEQQSLVKKNSLLKLIKGDYLHYQQYNNNYKPSVFYRIETPVPLIDLTESSFSSGGQVVIHPNYEADMHFDYSVLGNILWKQKFTEPGTSYIWDYKDQYPIAEVINSDQENAAYTSFEADGQGNWTFSGTPILEATSPTGRRAYNLSNGNLTKPVTNTGSYVVSYWRPSSLPALTIPGTQTGYPITGQTFNGWKYHEHKVTGVSSMVLSASGLIDEVRLYPFKAQMTTYTYDPLVGMTSRTDAKGMTTYYEYDGFQRLKNIKDRNGNILKNFCYNYKGDPTGCPVPGEAVYSSIAQSGSFTRADCGAGYVPGPALGFTVPAGKYTGPSQGLVDSLALADLNANGQLYANTNGTCIQIFSSVAKSGSFSKNDCDVGYIGGPAVTFTVPAGTYTASSQPAADSLAQADVNANGQAYANANGTCVSECSFTAYNGYTISSSSISSSGSVAMFYIVFNSSSGLTNWSSGAIQVATVNGTCNPSATNVLSVTENGRTWQVTISSAGAFTVQLLSGTAPVGTASITLTSSYTP